MVKVCSITNKNRSNLIRLIEQLVNEPCTPTSSESSSSISAIQLRYISWSLFLV